MEELIKIKGVIGKEKYRSGDFRIYYFYPSSSDINKVKIHPTYENINISGQLPELYDGIEYLVELEYKKNGEYDNYVVHKINKVNNNIDNNTTEAFLRAILTPNQADELLKHYPDIIERVIKNKPVDLKNVKGIKDKIFKVVKRKIIENFQLMDLVNEFHEYGMTFSMIKNLYDYYSSVDLIKKKMFEEPYSCLCKLNRVAFKTADKIIIKKYPEKLNSITRMEACIFHLINENEDQGNTWINLKLLYKNARELAPECIEYFVKALKDNEDLWVDKENNRISSRKAYKCEQDICNILLSLLNESNVLNVNYKEFNEADGIPLTEEQMNTLKNICEYQLSILAGVGGSGKSFSTKALIDMLDASRLKYVLFSPTGKASKVLASYTGKPASTIHRGLGFTPEGFCYNKGNKLPVDVVIIDEFSMIDIYLLRSLLEAIDVERTKVLFIGDPFQIPSVGLGNIAYDMIESKIIPITLLTKVFRYNEGGLAYVASQIRNGDSYLNYNGKNIQVFGTKKDYTFINTIQESSLQSIRVLYKKLFNQGVNIDDIMVLSAFNKGEYGTIKINSMLQELVNPYSSDKKEVKHKRDGEIITYRINDKVMQIVNNYRAIDDNEEETCIFNGDCGIIKKIINDNIYVDYGDRIIVYERGDLDQLTLAYAISIHKSQGSSSKYVILVTPKAHKHFLDRNLLYVAVSRAKEKVFHIGSYDVIQSSLKKSANFNRNTYLSELLQANN